LRKKFGILAVELCLLFFVFLNYAAEKTIGERMGQAPSESIDPVMAENMQALVEETENTETLDDKEKTENTETLDDKEKTENTEILDDKDKKDNTETLNDKTDDKETLDDKEKTENTETLDDKTDDNKTNNSKTDKNKTDHSKTNDSKSDYNKTDHSKTNDNKPVEDDSIDDRIVANASIRVLIKTSDSGSYYHKSVQLKPLADCQLSAVKDGKQEKIKLLKKGKKYTFKTSSRLFKKGVLVVTPGKNKKTQLCSVSRSCGNPSYRGTLELKKEKAGITIINELPLEEYLYAVVPSEMPSEYDLEAQKAQAVCARCYALSQRGSKAMKPYGADVDDSTAYQVYNNLAESKMSIRAVKETKGVVPVMNGRMITAYYFSTSSGYTADIKDAWGGSGTKYLTGSVQFIKKSEQKKELKLSKEQTFADFLEKETRQTFDSSYPWYRWEISMDLELLEESIKRYLPERITSSFSSLSLASGKKVSKDMEIGHLKSIKIKERAVSGMITCLEIVGTKQTLLVQGEYNIRRILSPEYAKVKRQDGSIVTNLSLLPSSFFLLEKKKNGYVISGGGYGHGIGMSQNGANTMAKNGYKWKEILGHYYPGITLVGTSD